MNKFSKHVYPVVAVLIFLSAVGLWLYDKYGKDVHMIDTPIGMPASTMPILFGGTYYEAQLNDGESDYSGSCPVCDPAWQIEIFANRANETLYLQYNALWEGGRFSTMLREGACYKTPIGKFRVVNKLIDEQSLWGRQWEMMTAPC